MADVGQPIRVWARRAMQWNEGSYQVVWLEGNCRVEQGDFLGRAERAVLWIDRSPDDQPSGLVKVLVYLEDGVELGWDRGTDQAGGTGSARQRLVDTVWRGRLYTRAGLEFVAAVIPERPNPLPPQVERSWPGSVAVRQAAFQQPAEQGAPRASSQRVRILPRGGGDLQFDTFHNPQRNETILVATNGVTIVVEGVRVENVPNLGGLDLGRIELEADNLVAWTTYLPSLNVPGGTAGGLAGGVPPLELYLEGNIVFRQGRRVIYADRLYYNVQAERGVVLRAEMLTPVKDYEGLLRLKADILQQLDRRNFAAYGAAVTSSRIGYPRYWVQSEQVTLQDEQRPRVDPITGAPLVDPVTGEVDVEHSLLATSRNNFLYVGGVPVFAWPFLATDLRKPSFYVDNLRIKNDSVFGTQVLVDLDTYQLLGIERPWEGTDWTISTDVLSERGPGLGTRFTYDRQDFFGHPTPVRGMLDAWGIFDSGVDNLGFDRRALVPEEEFRGRLLWRHRQQLPYDLQLTAETGLISDRNFLEQYFESEWDQSKDQTTGIELKQFRGHHDWALTADVRLNDFFTQTEWLPRFDHFLYGHALFGDRLTWNAHTTVGYGHLRTAVAPLNPIDAAKFDPLAWEQDREGLRAVTRQELSWPLALGPTKIVPYVLGEVGFWGEALDGSELTRLYGQTGVRASLPLVRVDPGVRNPLFNLNGLAHKVLFEAEVFYADASQDVTRLPLYDPLDDDSIEFFRRRFFFDTFGGAPGGDVPLAFDERIFAVRSNLAGWVTSPSLEIAEDLVAGRLAVRQRWQTKRGLPDRERIVDWITLDLAATLFPDPNRDNFGEPVGLINYDFRWHIGDRVALLSDGFFDTFADGLRTVSAATLWSRPGVGQLYVGFRSIEGPISSNILSGAVSYRMSDKWILTAGSSFDFGATGNIGQSVALTRIGESALIRLGVNVDNSRNNVGVVFGIEPRFLPSRRLGYVGGVQIPPAGALGLE
ncbi:MAG: hypothetical protein KatS3mg110_2217 [Pirellulaceae bacterium]|nr:MAG: hypothetical protein KatS3mg110_2217 [Pirellulaceae bacterium]